MIVNECAVDWLTVTGWDKAFVRPFSEDVVRALGCGGHKSKPGKVMQYEGNVWVTANLFMGTALQNGLPHMMVRVSGEMAHEAMSACSTNVLAFVAGELKATRVDVQLTVKSVAQDAHVLTTLYRSCAEAMRSKAKGCNPYGANITLYESDGGMCTLYVGNRESERFVRVYQKRDADGVFYTRVEVEQKGKVAQSFMESCLQDDRGIQPTMAGVIQRAVDLFNDITLLATHRRHLLSLIVGSAPAGERRVTDENATLDWLKKSVHPAVQKLANSPDYANEAYEAVLAMLRCFGD